MKRIRYNNYLGVILLVWGCLSVSCNDSLEGYEDEYFPSKEYYSYYFDYNYSGELKGNLEKKLAKIPGVGITSEPVPLSCTDNLSWRFTEMPGWLSFSQLEGTGDAENLTFSATANPSTYDSRSASFYFESTVPNFQMRRMFTAMQEKQEEFFEIYPSTKNFYYDADADEFQLEINTNLAWRLCHPTDQVNFLEFSHVSAEAGSNVLTVYIPKNDYLDGVSRSNTYYIYDNALTTCLHTFTVYQSPPSGTSSVSDRSASFSKDGGTQTLSLGSATEYRVECNAAWIAVTPTEGTGKVDLIVSVLPNTTGDSRSGLVYLYVNDRLTIRLMVSQNGAKFTLSEKELTVKATSATYKNVAVVVSDGSWKATSKFSWLTVSPTSGNAGDDYQISITTTDNNSLNGRKGSIVFERTDGIVKTLTLNVTQSGRYFNFGDYDGGVTVGPDAQTKECTFNGDLPWTASSSASWIIVNTTSGGVTSNKFTFNVTANATQESRTGEIIFKYEGGSKKFVVVQESAYLNTSETAIEIPSTGGGHEVTISANAKWLCTDDADWLSYSYNDADPKSVKLTAVDNPSSNDRTATVTFTLDADKSQKKLIITQKGRFLKVPINEVYFFLKGGKRDFYIETDGTLSVATSDTWLTATIETGNRLVLKAADNTSGSERSATVTVSVTGLKTGELKQSITVKQLNTNVIEREEYGEDVSIDLGSNGSMGVNKENFGSEKPLDGENSNNMAIYKNGFGDDKDLN